MHRRTTTPADAGARRRGRSSFGVVAAVVAALMLVAGACGNDDDSADSDSKKTTTTEKQTTTTEDSASPADQEDFDAALEEADAALTEAGDDPCAIAEVVANLESLPDPTDQEQGEQAVDLLVKMFNAMADTAPADKAESADALRNAATALQDEAESENYSVEFLEDPEAFKDPSFTAAIEDFATTTAQVCGTPGTDGATG